MALYLLEDIGSTFAGDLQLNSRGDLELGNTLNTAKSAANFVLRTDHGGYAPDHAVGANLGALIGEQVSDEAQELAQFYIERALTTNIFSAQDVRATVVPADAYELVCVVDLAGAFALSGQIVDAREEQMLYSFPYITGSPTPITI